MLCRVIKSGFRMVGGMKSRSRDMMDADTASAGLEFKSEKMSWSAP